MSINTMNRMGKATGMGIISTAAGIAGRKASAASARSMNYANARPRTPLQLFSWLRASLCYGWGMSAAIARMAIITLIARIMRWAGKTGSGLPRQGSLPLTWDKDSERMANTAKPKAFPASGL